MFPEVESLSAVSGESFASGQSQAYPVAGDSGNPYTHAQTRYPAGTSVRIAFLKTTITNCMLGSLAV